MLNQLKKTGKGTYSYNIYIYMYIYIYRVFSNLIRTLFRVSEG